jgi:predicted ATPase
MASAAAGEIRASRQTIDRSSTRFELVQLPPFSVKGKSKPIDAVTVGSPVERQAFVADKLPLFGRDAEMKILRDALAATREGQGTSIEIVGEAGIGKTRLLQEVIDEAKDFRVLRIHGEAYESTLPYAASRRMFRGALGLSSSASDSEVKASLETAVDEKAPSLKPWLPLLGLVFGLRLESTPEVDMLAPENKRSRLHDAMLEFADALLPSPTLIAIDAAEHLDEASGGLFAFLAKSTAERKWLVILAKRPDQEKR